MTRILTYLGFFLVAAVGGLFLVGMVASKDFSGELSDTIVAPPEDIWPFLVNPEKRKARLAIGKLSEIGTNSLGLQKWKEVREGRWYRYEILKEERPHGVTLALMNSQTGETGLWTYTLASQDGIHTVVTLQEKSRTPDFWERLRRLCVGRDRQIKDELQSIKSLGQKTSQKAASPN